MLNSPLRLCKIKSSSIISQTIFFLLLLLFLSTFIKEMPPNSNSNKRFTPPEDYHQVKGAPAKHFTHSAIEDKELWLLRIPDNLSLKDLDKLVLRHPEDATGILAETTNNKSKITYQITSSDSGLAEMSVMVPDQDSDDEEEDGDLTLLPNKCVRLLSVNEKLVIPDATKHAEEIANKSKDERQQPEFMKMQFIPYGFYSADEYRDMEEPSSKRTKMEVDPEAKKEKKTKKEKKDKKKKKKLNVE